MSKTTAKHRSVLITSIAAINPTQRAAKPRIIPDELVPDPQVWREFGISSMTGWRWTNDRKLGFPPPIKIRTRCFRSRRQIEAFKEKMLRLAITQRAARNEEAA